MRLVRRERCKIVLHPVLSISRHLNISINRTFANLNTTAVNISQTHATTPLHAYNKRVAFFSISLISSLARSALTTKRKKGIYICGTAMIIRRIPSKTNNQPRPSQMAKRRPTTQNTNRNKVTRMAGVMDFG